MTSLSDRNMSLGDVLLPQGGKQRCLCPRVQGLFTLRKVLLMQLSVALSLHYGWDSQLNTSEMFWIDISRWMISSRYWWISVYLLWRTAHALNLNLSCNVVSIGLRSWSCQLPSCNLFTSHSCFIVFWERDITSEHHETPVHITIIDHIRYLLFRIFIAIIPITIITCVWSFVNYKAGGIDNLSVLVGSKVICICVQVHVDC